MAYMQNENIVLKNIKMYFETWSIYRINS